MDLMLLKYHWTVAEIRLCDSPSLALVRAGERLFGRGSQQAQSDNAAGGKRRHVHETQSRVAILSKLHRLFLNLAMAARNHGTARRWLCPASRFAAPASAIPACREPSPDDVVGFFGFGSNQANNPTDPQPVAEPVQAGTDAARDRARRSLPMWAPRPACRR